MCFALTITSAIKNVLGYLLSFVDLYCLIKVGFVVEY